MSDPADNSIQVDPGETNPFTSTGAYAANLRLLTLSADVGRALTEENALDAALHRCVTALVTHLDAAFARIWTADEGGEMLELQASAGQYTHLDGPHGRVPVGKFKIGLIAAERKPHLTNRVLTDPRVSDPEWARREGMVAFAGHPLIVGEKLVGVMALFSRQPLPDFTLTALAGIANQIAVGIERQRLLCLAQEEVAARTLLAEENARLWRAERERSEQLRIAIAEVHDRVKNSLQSISALIEIQLPFDSDMMPVQTVREGLNQIKTIALVHDLLGRDHPMGDVDTVRVLVTLGELLSNGLRTEKCPVPIRVQVGQAGRVWIPTKAATALALSVNELVSNAVKHNQQRSARATAQSEPSSGDFRPIEVSLTQDQGELWISVQDSGPGFPPDFDPKLHSNIGLELVQTLVKHDLRGSVLFYNICHHPDGSLSHYPLRVDQSRTNRVVPPLVDATIRGARVEIIFPARPVAEFVAPTRDGT